MCIHSSKNFLYVNSFNHPLNPIWQELLLPWFTKEGNKGINKDALFCPTSPLGVSPPSRLEGVLSLGFPGGSVGKESACNMGDLGLIPRLGRSLREGNSYPVQYSGLENSMDYSPWGHKESDTTERPPSHRDPMECSTPGLPVPRHLPDLCSACL